MTDQDPEDAFDADWQEQLSALERFTLKAFPYIGGALFAGGLNLSIRDYPGPWDTVSAIGMIVAVQVYWGIDALFETLQKRRSSWLLSWGYRPLFWLVLFGVIVFDLILGGVMEHTHDTWSSKLEPLFP